MNYIITRNHIHLVVATDDNGVLPRSMRLVAGQVARIYNRRKRRRGAFWEDRYHAVPIKTQKHLIECLVYVDLNMVRAGVVSHPAEWLHAGYHEIQNLRKRYVIIDHERLLKLVGRDSLPDLQRNHRNWVADKLASGALDRDERWTTVGPGDGLA